MVQANEHHVISRRKAIAGLGVGGLAVALAAPSTSTSAQDLTTADHPLAG